MNDLALPISKKKNHKKPIFSKGLQLVGQAKLNTCCTNGAVQVKTIISYLSPKFVWLQVKESYPHQVLLWKNLIILLKSKSRLKHLVDKFVSLSLKFPFSELWFAIKTWPIYFLYRSSNQRNYHSNGTRRYSKMKCK